MIAGTLVHEATHARISRAGTIAIWGAGGRRAEVLCTRSERAFAQLLSTADYPSLDDWLHYLDKRIEALQADIGGTRPAA